MAITREIYYTTDNTQDISLWTKVTEPEASLSKLIDSIPGGTYYIRTRITDGANFSDFTTEDSQIVAAPALATPVLNTPTVVSDTQIDLSWTDVANETQYELQSSTDNATWTTEATLAADTVSYPDTGLTASTTYYYRLRAIGDGTKYLTSAWSATVSATTAAATSPTISSTAYNDTNTADITFSEGVYTNADGTGALTAADFAIANFVAGGATALSVSSVTKTDGTALAGGETVVRCVLALTGKAYGNETFNIVPASGTAIYDATGNAMASTETTAKLTLHPTGYDYLTNLQLAIDDVGLATGVTNKYGVVDGTGNVTKLKAIYPSAWNDAGINIPSGGTGITLSSGVVFDGTSRMVMDEGTGIVTRAKSMHHDTSGSITNFQNTHHFVARVGNVAEPDSSYGLIGTNVGGSSNIGVTIFYDDRSVHGFNHRIRALITYGNGIFIELMSADNAIVPNQLSIITVEFDASLAVADRAKLYVNGTAVTVTASGTDTQSTADATYPLDLGAIGNAVSPFVGTLRTYAYTHNVDTATNRGNFISWLKGKYGIA